MRQFTKKIAAVAVCGLATALSAAWAQTTTDNPDPKQGQMIPSDNTAADPNVHILRFQDQGTSPETNPSAHLLLVKDQQPPVAQVETQATVAQADVAPAPAPAPEPAPAPATTDTTSTTDNSAAATDNAMPAPRADRN